MMPEPCHVFILAGDMARHLGFRNKIVERQPVALAQRDVEPIVPEHR